MPASSSETRNRWRKRKREPLISRKAKAQQDDDVFEEEEDEEDIDQQEIEDEDHRNPSNSVDRSNYSVELVSEAGNQISEFPLVVRRTVTRPHSSVLNIVATEKAGQCGESRQNGVVLENMSYGQLQALSAVPADSPALLTEERGEGSGSGSYVISPPQILQGRGVVKHYGSASRIHVVPMHADWFSPNTVHRLERQVVPHFFSGKSAEHIPEKYMECRNCIVAKYMELPEKHLSVADCHGIVAGVSADDVTRIARFLDHWGIINYCAVPPKAEPLKGVTLYEDSNSDLCVPVAGLKSIDSLVQFDKPKCCLKARDVYPEVVHDFDDDSDFDNSIRELLSELRCNCCSRPVSLSYYQSQKEIDILLCLDCFHEGGFVTGHSSLDFVKVSSMKDYGDLDGDTWTDQETLLLLEGMQLYNENWNQIAEHVGTKSKAQCILHFVRLPVDGAPLENIELPGASGPSSSFAGEDRSKSCSNLNGNLAGPSTENLDSDSKFPFENCGNPGMSLVAFLASAVGPRVAAACAHAFLAALSKDDSLTSRNMTQIDGSTANNGISIGKIHGKDGSPHGDVGNSYQLKDEKPGGQGPWGQHDAGGAPVSTERVRAAAKVGLAAAAIKAKLFADHEEREIQRLSANIVNHQLKRLELKLKQFAEVETLLMKECEQLERTRQRFAAERARMMTVQPGSVRVSRPMGVSGAGSPVVSNTGNSRQQVASGPLQQSFISGYGNNQPMHPHMSFMQQQGMYGFGPRLPLSAIHPSSSTPGMFNAPASSQPALSHSMLRPLSGTKSGLG